MRVAVLGLLVAILLAVAWIGGEQHKQACILEPGDSQGCTVLPWSKGQAPKPRVAPAPNLFDQNGGIVIKGP